MGLRRTFLKALYVMSLLYLTRESFAVDLQVLWLAPIAKQEGFTLASSMGPFALAIENVTNSGLLHHYGVNITWADSACHPKYASGNFVAVMLRCKPDVVFGPPCTKAMIPVADMASFFDIPIYSWVSNMLVDKSVKTTLMRAIAPLSSLGDLLIFFCAKMRWFRLSMISTMGELTEGMANFYKQSLEHNDEFYLAREYNGIREGVNRTQIERMFSILKTETRIIILVVPREEVRRYLIVADELGMTNGDYQFLYTEHTVADKEFLERLQSTSFWKNDDEDDEKARRGYHNLLYFTYHYVTEWSLNTSASIHAAERIFGSNPELPKPEDPDKYSRFLYDAFYLYALAVNETIYKNLTPTGANIFNASKNKIFQGQTGRFLTNDEADRQSSFLIWDMNKNNIFQQVVITRYSVDGKITWDLKAPILWGNGKKYNGSDDYIPPDIPYCGYFNENCTYDNLVELVAPPIIVTLMLAGFIAFLIIFRWWKKERELYETLWKVKYSELNFNIARGPLSQAAISSVGSKQSLNDCSDNRSEVSTGNVSGYSNLRPDNMVMISQMFTLVAKLNGDQVAVRKVRKKSIREDKLLLKEMKIMKSLKHTNLATFHGACTESPNICVLWEYCSKGSLEDILHNTDIKLESMFQFSIALDICTGLNYLHNSELGVHGRVKTSNCVVDSRWVAKLTDFGLQRLKKGEKPAEETSTEKFYTDLYWTAPEVLRSILNNEKPMETKEADIYSLAIVFKQLLCKNTAFSEEINYMTSKEIILRVANIELAANHLRPHINSEFPEHQAVMMSFVNLIKSCWVENPAERPNIKRVLGNMKRMSPLKMTGVLDNMLALMERYSTRLEDLVSERTLQLEEEKRKTDTLLYRMLPRKVADDLKAGQNVQAEAFQDVTIYFSDIVGFTTLAGESTPMEIVEMLNLLYSQFDNIIQNFNVYKVETIGDAYMTVCGVPEPNPDHAPVMADMSLALLDSVIHFVIPHRPHNQLRIRIGLNSGPVVAGVVGNTMPRYCLFGNTVNLASRMESQGMAQRIQISFYTYEILKKDPDFIMVPRGLVEIKGKGRMPTYWLMGRRSTMQFNQEIDDQMKCANIIHNNGQNEEAISDLKLLTKERQDNKSGPEDSAKHPTRHVSTASKCPKMNLDTTETSTVSKEGSFKQDRYSDIRLSGIANEAPDMVNGIDKADNSSIDKADNSSINKADNSSINKSQAIADQHHGQVDDYLDKTDYSHKFKDKTDNDSSEELPIIEQSDDQSESGNFGRSFSERSFGSNENLKIFQKSKDIEIPHQNGQFKQTTPTVSTPTCSTPTGSPPKPERAGLPQYKMSKKGNPSCMGQISATPVNSGDMITHKYLNVSTRPDLPTNPNTHKPGLNTNSPSLSMAKFFNPKEKHVSKSFLSGARNFQDYENGTLGAREKDTLKSKVSPYQDLNVQYSSDEDTPERTSVIYSPKTGTQKNSPIQFIPGKEYISRAPVSILEGTNGLSIHDTDEGDMRENKKFLNKHKIANPIDFKSINPSLKKNDNFLRYPSHPHDNFLRYPSHPHIKQSSNKKPHDKFGHHPSDRSHLLNPSDRSHLLNSPHYSGSPHIRPKQFDGHLEFNKNQSTQHKNPLVQPPNMPKSHSLDSHPTYLSPPH